jgi:hypothetical protein
MANFSFTVDTREMAESLYSVAPHIEGTTAAVVSMQGAVILAERHAAENICANVNRGFFSLIRSQISQKVAMCRSQVDARLLEMRDLAQKLTSVKTTMQRDFQMIAMRYTKLFRSLDHALLGRVHELHRPLVDLVQKDVLRLTGRTLALQAEVPMHQMESVSTSQKVAASGARARAGQAIGAMARFIGETYQQDRLTESILGNESVKVKAAVLFPIALVDSDSLQSQQSQWQYRAPTPPVHEMTQRLRGAVESGVFPLLQRLEWRPQPPVEREQVARCFNQLLAKAQLASRVSAQMATMFAAAQPNALFRVNQ